MIVYNKDKTQILETYDLTKGHLIPSTITKEKPAVEEIKEVGHYETIKEYSNGGKDVKYIIDIKGVKAEPAKTITEDIYIYIPYTDKDYYKQEYNTLINWFNIEYTKLEQKYRRLHTLGKLTDVGKEPYSELINLYNEAEIKRARIQELERLLSDSSK